MPKKLLPVEEYIEDRRKEGFSCDDILKALRKKGYADDVVALADKTYHLRNVIKGLGVMVVIAVIVAAVVVWGPKGGSCSESIFAPGTGERSTPMPAGDEIIVMDAFACLSLVDASKRLECLSAKDEQLQSIVGKSAGFKDPLYPVSMQAAGILAGWKNDPAWCSMPDPIAAGDCRMGVPFFRAQITDDPAVCLGLPDLGPQRQCILSVLAARSPPQDAELVEFIAKASFEASSSMDKSRCQSLPFDFAKAECESAVLTRQAVQGLDQAVCNEIKEGPQRLHCLQAVVERVQGIP